MLAEHITRPPWDVDIREAIYEQLVAAWQSSSRVAATEHLNEAVRLLFVAHCPSEADLMGGPHGTN
jgi:hypothetical protein